MSLFEQVGDALKSLMAKKWMMVMAQVDQGKMLSMTGLSLKATLFLVGNPTVGKQTQMARRTSSDARLADRRDIALVISGGALSGAAATLALEAVRYSGFRVGFMPGNLPQLMGVLLLDRFALGPSGWSDLAGLTYHFWNGAVFGILFLALAPSQSVSLAALYGIAIGLGFLVSLVVQSLGVGLFGRDFGWPFAATVLAAHAAFGVTLGLLLNHASVNSGARGLPGGKRRSITARA